jgi:integrase
MESEKFLKPEEFARLLKAAKDDRKKCIFLLLASAGLRVSEMVAVRAEDIYFGKAYLHIRSAQRQAQESPHGSALAACD